MIGRIEYELVVKPPQRDDELNTKYGPVGCCFKFPVVRLFSTKNNWKEKQEVLGIGK